MPHLPALTDLETLSIPQLAPLLLDWYDKNARSMPWRGPHVPPYHTWVSEIMLQQTRVEAVTPYFYRFIQALPTIAHMKMLPISCRLCSLRNKTIC